MHSLNGSGNIKKATEMHCFHELKKINSIQVAFLGNKIIWII